MALLKFTYTSEAVNTNMEFYALIPQKRHIRSQDSPDLTLASFQETYPVTILLHDMHSSPGGLIRQTGLERLAYQSGQLILLPQGYLSYYTDYAARDDAPTPLNPATGTSGNFTEMCYGTYIVPELLDYAQAVLPVSSSPQDVCIGGIGMGGFGALKLGALHPDRVGCVFSIDGHVDLQWLMDHNPSQKEQFKAVFGSLRAKGSNDLAAVWSSSERLPALFQSWQENGPCAQMNRNFANAVNRNSIKHTDTDFQIRYCCFPDNVHTGWNHIDNALAQALGWTGRLNKKKER